MVFATGAESPRNLPSVSPLARRIHGWSWQAFPIGMGTGAVYVTLSGLRQHSTALTAVETGIMTTGFLDGHQANGAFVACGPPGFTALALINLGARARDILPRHSLVSPLAGEIWYSTSVMTGILLFGLAVFFFVFGALPYWFKVHKHLSEILGCWALTFTNVGWIVNLRIVGEIFNISGFYVVYLILAILMCITWAVLFVLTVVAFYKGLIFISKEEDVLKDSRIEGLGVDVKEGMDKRIMV